MKELKIQLESDIKILHMELLKHFIQTADPQEKSLEVLAGQAQSELNSRWEKLSQRYSELGVPFGDTPTLLKQTRGRIQTLSIVAVGFLAFFYYSAFLSYSNGHPFSFISILFLIIITIVIPSGIIYYHYYKPAYKKILKTLNNPMLSLNLQMQTNVQLNRIKKRKKMVYLIIGLLVLWVLLDDNSKEVSNKTGIKTETTKVTN